MQLGEVLTMLQTASIVIGLVVALSTLRGRTDTKAAELAEMRVDIKYIKDTISKMDPLPARVTAVEEATKSAHKRLDALERGGKL